MMAGTGITSDVWLRRLPLVESRALLRGERCGPAELGWHPEYPMDHTLIAIAMLIQAHEAHGWDGRQVPDWWIHQIVTNHEVVGDCGFHGPASDDRPAMVEIGYDVVPGWRRRGVATRACALLLEQAWRDGADVVTAETDLDHLASQKVLLHNGFVALEPGWFTISNPARRAVE